jgi:hypothetical protein
VTGNEVPVEVIYRQDRDPFKILIIAACVAYSAFALPVYERFGSPSLKAFPTSVAMAFLSSLFILGMITLTGIVRVNGRLEGIGMFGLSGIWACFAVMGISTSGAKAMAFSSFLIAFAFAAAWTWWQKIGRPWWARRRQRREGRGAA